MKKNLKGIILMISVLVTLLLGGVVFVGIFNSLKGNNTSKNNTVINLYADTLTLVDGDIKNYHLYKSNGDEVNMKIYKITDYLVAYQNLNKDYNYFGFAFYNINNEDTYVLKTNDLGNNVKNTGFINTYIEDKSTDFSSTYDIGTKFANSNSANEYSDEKATIEKISDITSKVKSIKQWGEEEYTFFIDINEKNIAKFE